MSVLRAYFNEKVEQCSPVQYDLERVVKRDEDGNEFVTYSQVDYPKLVKSNGTVDMWSLENLLKAGIDPRFGIHTGYGTRIEGVGEIEKASSFAEKLVSEVKDSE